MGFALLTTSSEAQVLYGSITGTVRDPSDAAIPGAFNVTNTPKFGNPNGDVNSGNFMRILGLLNGYDQRQFRLGLRFSF